MTTPRHSKGSCPEAPSKKLGPARKAHEATRCRAGRGSVYRLDPEPYGRTGRPWLFIDPAEAMDVLNTANLGVEPPYMTATDIWDSCSGIEPHALRFRMPRQDYGHGASENGATNSR
jgi:hypothetical protein